MGKTILITGGAGYVGSMLTERLVSQGNKVLIYDTCFYGKSHIHESDSLKLIEADIRDVDSFEKATEGVDIVIHLACISNDPSFALNENLCKTINFDCFEDLVRISKKQKVKRFIYASSSSVYGFSDSDNVTEEQRARFAERQKQMKLAQERGEGHIGHEAQEALLQRKQAKQQQKEAQRKALKS